MHAKFRSLIGALLVAAPLMLGAQDTTHVADSAAAAATAQQLTQQSTAEAEQHAAAQGQAGAEDFITPHVTDAPHLEVPYWKYPYHTEIHLPTGWIVHIGNYALDLSPTKHVVFMALAALVAAIILITAANSSRKMHNTKGYPRGFAAGMEAMALYLRNEVVLPNVGHHGEKYVPYLMSIFFFILFCNMFGLIPYGSTATGNISVTATLAILTFIVVEVAGMRANGLGYLSTIFYWNKDLALPMRIIMFIVMTPIEIVGKIAKPFALAVRLFANMTAGHIVVLAIIGLIFAFGSWIVAPGPVLMATAIMLLEIFVAFLQAFIFTLLASVFIGQIREAHH